MKLAITTGDPNGIGIEVTVKALKQLADKPDIILIGPEDILTKELKNSPVEAAIIDPGDFKAKDLAYGQLTEKAGRNSVLYVKKGIELAQNKEVAALVTAPINKEAIKLAKIQEAGHTEIIKSETGCQDVAMMFYAEEMRLILSTIHVSLAQVPKLLTKQKLTITLNLGIATTKQFGIQAPKIAVAGLNPHAGENGLFGNEEMEVIAPVINDFQKQGFNISGPYPADTLFTKGLRDKFDLIVTHYHDQGLNPFKALYFDKAVNITCGAPIIRTSVDHGTAFDIAGQGIASPSSMIEAIEVAQVLANNLKLEGN